jgi:Zn-dependent peptidase ImmA (M78 family)/transcriptional regulator with XRE-family HTH domain
VSGRDRLQDAARLFDGQRLTLARHLTGWRKNELAEKIGKTPTAVASYESGLKRPAASTVGQLSLVLGVEPEFFLSSAAASTVAVASDPHFRSLRSTTQIARDRARAFGDLVREIAASLERHVDFPKVTVPSIPVDIDRWDADEPAHAASSVRAAWNVASGPIQHMVRLVENNGVVAAFTSTQIAAIDAYSFSSAVRPIILLNPTKDDYYRQRWDVAHELGHLVMHADAEPGSRDAEDQANRFAAEFLLPEAQIRQQLPARADWRYLLELKERWGVSIQALLFRSRRLGVMPERAYKTAMTTVSARGWRRQEPGGSVLVEQPSLLPKAVEILRSVAIDEQQLASECRVPLGLFRIATSRTPIAADEAITESEGKKLTLVPSSHP